jgi:2'-5' RNA ligase
MTRAYISAKLEHDLRLRSLRDRLYNCIDGSKYYRKIDPHITVIPPFNIKDGHEEEVQELVDKSSLTGKEVVINSLAVWENISKPYVVMLNISIDMEEERERLLDGLEGMTVNDIPQPVRPHITLFKTGEWYESHPERTKESIQQEIMDRNRFMDTKVHKVETEFKSN